MSDSQIADRFANLHPRHRLLACDPAFIPYFLISAPVLLQHKQQVPPIDEFVLRLVKQGIKSPAEMALLLGLDVIVTQATLSRLWQSDLVDFKVDRESRSPCLTPQGEQTLKELVEVTPIEREIWFAFDRLLWKPMPIATSSLVRTRDIRSSSSIVIRPRSGKRLTVGDLSARDVDRAIKEGMRNVLSDAEVLVIKRIDRAEQKFLPCHVLVYESDDQRSRIVEIVIDGRRREDLRATLESLGGAQWLDLKFDPPVPLEETLNSMSTEMLAAARSHLVLLDDVQKVRTGASSGVSDDAKNDSDAESVRAQASSSVDQIDHRQLDTWEHAEFLVKAFDEARERILIISPWINRSVVTRQFLDNLERAAKRGVEIRIGFGIGGREDGKSDESAIKLLQGLAAKFSNVVIADLRGTHAKVLLWDRTQISTSFNWLSFRGDRDRTYRQEAGILLRNVASIDQFWYEQSGWIEREAQKAACSVAR